MEKSQYITPSFYKDYIHTPGNLVPPKWYAGMPAWAHRILEREVLGKETLFQTTTGLIAIIIYALILPFADVSKVLGRLHQSLDMQESISRSISPFSRH